MVHNRYDFFRVSIWPNHVQKEKLFFKDKSRYWQNLPFAFWNQFRVCWLAGWKNFFFFVNWCTGNWFQVKSILKCRNRLQWNLKSMLAIWSKILPLLLMAFFLTTLMNCILFFSIVKCPKVISLLEVNGVWQKKKGIEMIASRKSHLWFLEMIF